MSGAKTRKVVIFDTGAGGRLFAKYFAKKNQLGFEITTVIDDKNSPYGNRSEAEIRQMTEQALSKYIGQVEVIILACNTATAVAIDYLREKYPRQIFVGFEPMIKTADKLSKTRNVVVLATKMTKKSQRYQKLKRIFPDLNVIEPNCDDWAPKIDKGTITRRDIEEALAGNLANVDVVILACTHYVAIYEIIRKVVGKTVEVTHPFEAVTNYVNKIFSKKP